LPRRSPEHLRAESRDVRSATALIDIISIAQQASPNVIGQIEFLRAQLMGGVQRREDQTFARQARAFVVDPRKKVLVRPVRSSRP